MGVQIKVTSGPSIEKSGDLSAIKELRSIVSENGGGKEADGKSVVIIDDIRGD